MLPNQVACRRWEHDEKQRYFEVRVCHDLFGATVVIRTWGQTGSSLGGNSETLVDEGALAETLERIAHRRHQHGYRLCHR